MANCTKTLSWLLGYGVCDFRVVKYFTVASYNSTFIEPPGTKCIKCKLNNNYSGAHKTGS